MAKEGPTLRTNSTPTKVEKNDDGSVTVHFEQGEPLTADCLVWAVGRKPANQKYWFGRSRCRS